MLIVGLTGGIGSGKSKVASLLADYGIRTIDSDQLARRAVEPGTEASRQILSRFGASVFSRDGSLDRQKMAEVAFADPRALEDLNKITHPAVASLMAQELAEFSQLDAERGKDQIVILEIPLLTKSTKTKYLINLVVVVDSDDEVRLERLVTKRKMNVLDARARMASQISRGERLELADYVIENNTSEQDLQREVEKCYTWLESQLELNSPKVSG